MLFINIIFILNCLFFHVSSDISTTIKAGICWLFLICTYIKDPCFCISLHRYSLHARVCRGVDGVLGVPVDALEVSGKRESF